MLDEEAEVLEEEVINVLTRKELQNSRSRLRNALQRDAAASEKRARNIASQLLHQSESSYVTQRRTSQMKSTAIINGVVGLSSKVLNSLNITPKINVRTSNVRYTHGRPVNCWTDFESINIGIDADYFNPDKIDSMTELVHIVKGLTYHEGGHILYTTAQVKLCNTVGCTSRHENVPLTILEKHMVIPDFYNFDTSVLMAWNMLEDQRMECQMVMTSPVMARYFTTIVAKYVIEEEDPGNAWPWIVARTYLPKTLRQMVRDIADTHAAAEIIPMINEVAMRYRNSSDPVEMHQAVLDMAQYLTIWTESGGKIGSYDEHRFTRSDKTGDPNAPQLSDFEVEKSSEPNDNEGNDAEGEEKESENGGEGDGESTDNGDNQENTTETTAGNKSAGHGKSESSIRDYLNNLVNDNISQTSSNEVENFVSEVNDTRSQMALPDTTVRPMANELVKSSINVKNGMLDVLDRLVVNVDPSWLFYQEDGIIDPTAYLTREPGEMNFWSGMNGDNSNGHDLAVSLLIDSSGSMDGRIAGVSVIAMGIRKACEHYDIPCTITTFSDEVKLVVAGDKDIDFVQMDASGGTHVMDAMMILDKQQYGKRNHLVVILTDGEWSDTKDIRVWGKPTRHIMIVGVNVNHEIIANKGANTAITISNVNELAPLVTNALAGYFIS